MIILGTAWSPAGEMGKRLSPETGTVQEALAQMTLLSGRELLAGLGSHLSLHASETGGSLLLVPISIDNPNSGNSDVNLSN